MPLLLGTAPHQVPTNGDLGTMAFQDAASTQVGNLNASGVITTGADANIYGVTVGRGGGSAANSTAVGNEALLLNTTGTSNTAYGVNAIYSNVTGSFNTGSGFKALFGNTGSNNTAVGYLSGYLITSGSKNTILGSFSGNQGGVDIRTSSNNIVISDGDGNPRQVIDASGNTVFGGRVETTSGGFRFPDASTQYTAATGFGFKNRIINGSMTIDQRNAGASVTPINSQYLVDRWFAGLTQASKFTAQQTPSATETGYASRVTAGFTNYLAATSSSAYSVGAGDIFYLQQRVEGLNFSDLAWGTAGAKTVTLSFWVYSSLTGTFGGALNNSAFNYCYPFSYSIPVANTWTQISITIAGPTSGTWSFTNTSYLGISFSLGGGSSFSGTAGAWTSAGTYYTATGATSVVGTSGATFYITGVQLEKGSTATTFDYRPYGTELALCQRYFEVGLDRNALVWGGVTIAAAGIYYTNKGFCVTKRASPIVTTSNEVLSGFASGAPGLTLDSTGIQASKSSNGTATTSAYYFYNWQASAEL